MSLTSPSEHLRQPTTDASNSAARQRLARVTIQVALVVELVVDVEAEDEAEARRGALESGARLAWDEISMAAARALRTSTIEGPARMAQGLTIIRVTAGEAPELLVRHGGDDGR